MAPRKTRLERITRIRRSDLARAMPLTIAYGLVMAALYVLKPVRNALFLDRFSVGELPIVLLLVAVAGAVTAVAYGRLAASLRIDRLLTGLFGLFVAALIVFRIALPGGQSWVVYLFYLWVALYGLIATSIIWQLANLQFNAREARRLFGFIGSGGIAGAIVGGVLTGAVANVVGTENLLLAAAACICASWVSLRISGSNAQIRVPESERTEMMMPEIGGSRLLRLIAASGALIALCAVVADVQFNDVVASTFAGKDDKTAFFGAFFASLNLLAIVVQVVLTPRVLTSAGVGAALLVLPLGFGLGTLGFLLLPALATGILPKLADGALRHSLNKAASEILFIPLPAVVTRRAKLFVDVTVDSSFTGIGALLVLLLTREFGLSFRALGVLSLVLVAIWLVVSLRLRGAYVDAFRQALLRRELDLAELRINVSDASTVDALVKALDGGTSRQLRYALDMLVSVRDERLERRVPELCRHPAAEVRARALRVLASQRGGAPSLGAELLDDADADVRVEAVNYLCRHGELPPVEQLRRLLEHERVELRAAAVGAIALYGSSAELQLLDRERVRSLMAIEGDVGELVRVHIARVLAHLQGAESADLWPQLMRDPSEAVVRQTIDSAGRVPDMDHVPWLFELLDDTRYRMDARLALANHGDAVLGEIDARLSDLSTSNRVRRTLPRILARIDSQRSVDILLSRIGEGDEVLKRAAIGALEKLRQRFPRLRFDDPRIGELLWSEIEAYRRRDEAGTDLAPIGTRVAGALLLRSLSDKKAEGLHRIFQLLSLIYPVKDMATAYRALTGVRPERKASALEFLDNVLSRELKERIVPLLERDGRLSGPPGDPIPALRRLFETDDGWIRACALTALQELDGPLARRWAQEARRDDDALVREAAELMLGPGTSVLPASGQVG